MSSFFKFNNRTLWTTLFSVVIGLSGALFVLMQRFNAQTIITDNGNATTNIDVIMRAPADAQYLTGLDEKSTYALNASLDAFALGIVIPLFTVLAFVGVHQVKKWGVPGKIVDVASGFGFLIGIGALAFSMLFTHNKPPTYIESFVRSVMAMSIFIIFVFIAAAFAEDPNPSRHRQRPDEYVSASSGRPGGPGVGRTDRIGPR